MGVPVWKSHPCIGVHPNAINFNNIRLWRYFSIPAPSFSMLSFVLGVSRTTDLLSWGVAGAFCVIMAAGFMTCLPVVTTIINNCANPDRYIIDNGIGIVLIIFVQARID